MAGEQKLERIIPDYLNLPFEYFFKIIGNDGVLSYETKCLALVLLLYIPGLIITTLTGTVTSFVTMGWGFFLSNILIGVIVWLLVGFLREMEDKIVQVSEIIAPPKSETGQKEYERLADWKTRIDNYRQWAHSGHPYLWYYFEAFAAAVGGFLICKFVILERGLIGWIQNNPLNEWYTLTWFVAFGFIGGVCLYYIFTGFWIIRKYCKNVVSEKEVMPLDPDHTGGLRELGRLALDLDLVVALPSLAFLIYFPWNPGLLSIDVLIGLSIGYCLVLIFVFFISLSPAHNDMLNAKIAYLLKIHHEYRETHQKLYRKLSTEEHLDSRDFERVEDLHRLYDHVESMAVWPLDYRTVLRFLITSLLPLIASIITVSVWP